MIKKASDQPELLFITSKPAHPAFDLIMHALSWLAPNGTAAIVCFPGIMYRGGAEQKIRKYLIDNNYIEAIIRLPENLFFGTNIATCIMVMKKGKTDNSVLFIDASEEFEKATNNNRLGDKNINYIVDIFSRRCSIDHFSRLVNYDDIVAESYDLSVGTYIEKKSDKEIINIEVLNEEIQRISQRQSALRSRIDQIIFEIEQDNM